MGARSAACSGGTLGAGGAYALVYFVFESGREFGFGDGARLEGGRGDGVWFEFSGADGARFEIAVWFVGLGEVGVEDLAPLAGVLAWFW